jgi:two-component system, cell cycle sensor histidine kinase and response regulator CckA
MVRDLLEKILARAGFNVLLAANGEEALSAAFGHDGQIALVIADIVMPRMSGRELVERLRIIRPEARALYISGYSPAVIARHGLADSRVPLLEKPFTPGTVVRTVRQVLATPGQTT